jgi:hypothetical protein
MKKLIVTSLILALAIGLFAVDGVSGYVKWIHTGTPISGASMSIWYHDNNFNQDYLLSMTTQTNTNGYYSISFSDDPSDNGFYFVQCILPDGRVLKKQFAYVPGCDPTVNFFVYPENIE